MDDDSKLLQTLTYFEGADVEYKAAKGGLPASLWETYSAFANTEGGTIWLGVTQRGEQLEIHGVKQPEKWVADFWNAVNNRSKVNTNLLCNQDVTIVPVASGQAGVIRIQVPRADRRQRPVFLNNDPLGSTFRRNHEGDYRCTQVEVRRMFADQSDESADSRILQGFSLTDLHLDSLRQFRNLAASTRLGQAWLAADDVDLLRKLGGWRLDRTTAEDGLTLAGLLMFGLNQAIRDPAALPGFHLDYREHFSENPAIRWTDRLTPDGTWEGNLFQFYQKVMLKLATGPGILRPFQTDASGHRVATTPVGEALQEALVNALIHADYSGQGGIVIDRASDRLVFSNPGTLLVSRAQLLQGGISECRNKALQLMFQVLGAGDKAGSGIDKIRTSWAGQHWRAPNLHETQRPERVVLELPMTSALPSEVLEQLQHRFGTALQVLSPAEMQALATAAMEGEVSNHRLQELLPLHRTDITSLLRQLVDLKMLEPQGLGRGTRYVLGNGTGDDSFFSPLVGSDSPHVGSNSPHVGSHVGSSAPQLASLSHAVANTATVALLMPDALLGLSESERMVVDRVASGQAPRSLTRQAILLLCRNDFMTVRQLCEVLHRNPDGLRDRFLAEMVASGLLEPRFVAARHHRHQAYRAKTVAAPTKENA